MAPEVEAAFVSAVGFAFASIIAVVGVVWEWHQKNAHERRDRIRVRRESQRNLLQAIRIDVSSERYATNQIFGKENAEAEIARFLKLVRETGDRKMPQSATAPSLFMVEDFKTQLHLLPPSLMSNVTAFYKLNSGLNVVLEEMKRGVYDGLAKERQEKLIVELFKLGARVLDEADQLTVAIDSLLNSGYRHPYSGAPISIDFDD